MTLGLGRLLARSLRDVTSVRPEDLRLLRNDAPMSSEPLRLIEQDRAKSHVICVASGKGGTGKTVVTTNLAVSLAREGLSVLLFDADVGLANAHLLLGISPEHDISSVLGGRMSISDIAVECQCGLRLISGGSGLSDMSELKSGEARYLAEQFKILEDSAEIVLIDLPAGIGSHVMRFLSAAHDVIVVTTPDVTAMLDAYATIKALASWRGGACVKLIVNRARDRNEAMAVFKKICAVTKRREIGAEVSFFGWVPQNWYIQDSISRREPAVLLHPRSFVASCFNSIAERTQAVHDEWLKARDAEGQTEASSFSSRLSRMVFA